MKSILGIVVVLAVIVGGVGYSLDWFSVSKDGVTMNQEKMKEDLGKAGENIKEGVAKGVEKTKQIANAAAKKGKEWANAAASTTKEAWASLSEKAKGAYNGLKAKLGAGETAFVGAVESIDEAGGTITVKMADGTTKTYALAENADVQLNEAMSSFASLTSGDDAAIAVDESGKVVKVHAVH